IANYLTRRRRRTIPKPLPIPTSPSMTTIDPGSGVDVAGGVEKVNEAFTAAPVADWVNAPESCAALSPNTPSESWNVPDAWKLRFPAPVDDQVIPVMSNENRLPSAVVNCR